MGRDGLLVKQNDPNNEGSSRQSGELEVSGFVCELSTASVKTPLVLKLNINGLITDGQRSDVELSVPLI